MYVQLFLSNLNAQKATLDDFYSYTRLVLYTRLGGLVVLLVSGDRLDPVTSNPQKNVVD